MLEQPVHRSLAGMSVDVQSRHDTPRRIAQRRGHGTDAHCEVLIGHAPPLGASIRKFPFQLGPVDLAPRDYPRSARLGEHRVQSISRSASGADAKMPALLNA